MRCLHTCVILTSLKGFLLYPKLLVIEICDRKKSVIVILIGLMIWDIVSGPP